MQYNGGMLNGVSIYGILNAGENMTALQYFRLFAPEFAAFSDAEVLALIEVAKLFVNVDCLDDQRAALALALYAAHLRWTTVNLGNGGSVGTLKREREGDLEREYATTTTATGSNDWLKQSPYGMHYSNIVGVCAAGGIMTRYGQNLPAFPASGGVHSFVSYAFNDGNEYPNMTPGTA